MADFVAVIRRAVDGLSDNNAEMRQKVYEKARGAVRRQLESMNPRPSDDLVKRQLDKLEAAIAERAKKAGVEECYFDRGGFLFHGKIKALADAAREGGLKF